METLNAGSLRLCLGIDPDLPVSSPFLHFEEAVRRHEDFLDWLVSSSFLNDPHPRISLKFQLAFFLRFGLPGLKALTACIQTYRDHFDIILDGKFNDIQNSLQAYLDFAFVTLGVNGITLNPYFGTRSLEFALEQCSKHWGPRGRLYILCATTEKDHKSQPLNYLHSSYEALITVCGSLKQKLMHKHKNDPGHAAVLGLVIGATEASVIKASSVLAESGLSVLAPGLGAQKASLGNLAIFRNQLPKSEITFPVSRGLFEGGRADLDVIKERFIDMHRKFQKVIAL